MIPLFHVIFMVLLVSIAVRAAPMLDPYNAGNDSSDAAVAMPLPMLMMSLSVLLLTYKCSALINYKLM